MMGAGSSSQIFKLMQALLLLMLLLWASFPVPAKAQAWQEIAAGVAYKKMMVPVAGDPAPIGLHVVRAEFSKVKIETMYVSRVVKSRDPRQVTYNLRSLGTLLKPIALINGGYTATLSFPIPTGLLIDDGKELAPLNSKSSLLTGVFCVTDQAVSIVKKEDYHGGCNHGLQAGPIVVENPGKIGIDPSEKTKRRKYVRSLVGIDKAGRLLLIKTSEAFLYDLASFLVKKESEGGIDCTVALNLSGDFESGLYLPAMDSPLITGNVDTPIASAIAIFKK